METKEYGNYIIPIDGSYVFSKKKNSYLKIQENSPGYKMFWNNDQHKWNFIHQIVALLWLGVRPQGTEVSHRNGNKHDNRADNLEYISHKDNILKSYREHGRITDGNKWRGLKRTEETKRLMAVKKYKPVVISIDNYDIPFQSIEDAVIALRTCRKKINRKLSGNDTTNDWSVKYE